MKRKKSSGPDDTQPELPFGSAQKFRGVPWYPDVEKRKPSCCPLCHQPTNLYKRPISVVVARALIRLYHMEQAKPEQKWHHIRDIYRDRGDWAKLKFWGLIEEAGNQDIRKRTSGLWRITDEGKRFILCQDSVPKYALVQWNSTLVGFCGEAVTLRECVEFKNTFSYKDLMASVVSTE